MAPPDNAASGDVIIGICGSGDAGSLEAAIAAVRRGAWKYLEPSRTRIVLASGDSGLSELPQAFLSAAEGLSLTTVSYEVHSRDLLRLPYHGQPGRAHALRALLETTRSLGGRACAVLNATPHRDLTPEQVRWLARPVLDGEADFVTPWYPRHLADGAITKSILSPAFRAVFGCPIRQPAALEFGCSAAALAHLLAQRAWDEVGDEAVDLWMTTEAVCGGLRICEAQLAGAQHAPDAVDAVTALSQIVGSLFVEVERRAARWQRVRPPQPFQRVGFASAPEGPEPVKDVRQLLESFQLGYAELHDVWSEILPPMTLLDLKALARAPLERFRMDDRTWARIVYDFAVGYHLQVIRRDHLMGSLTPLYFGWLSSFVVQMQHACATDVDRRLEAIDRGFEDEKPYLISRWRWPERFRS